MISGGLPDNRNPLKNTLIIRDKVVEEGPQLPFAVYQHCQVEVKDSVFVLGGRDKDWTFIKSVQILKDRVWSLGAAMSTARYQHTCIEFKDLIYVVGGKTEDSSGLLTVDIYDPQTDTWNTGPSLTEPVVDGQLVYYHNQLYLLGGTENTKVFTLSADPDAKWEAVSGVSIEAEERKFFPAPVVTIDMLYCANENE